MMKTDDYWEIITDNLNIIDPWVIKTPKELIEDYIYSNYAVTIKVNPLVFIKNIDRFRDIIIPNHTIMHGIYNDYKYFIKITNNDYLEITYYEVNIDLKDGKIFCIATDNVRFFRVPGLSPVMMHNIKKEPEKYPEFLRKDIE